MGAGRHVALAGLALLGLAFAARAQDDVAPVSSPVRTARVVSTRVTEDSTPTRIVPQPSLAWPWGPGGDAAGAGGDGPPPPWHERTPNVAFFTEPPYVVDPWQVEVAWVTYLFAEPARPNPGTDRQLVSSIRLDLGLPASLDASFTIGYGLRSFEDVAPGAPARQEALLDSIAQLSYQPLHEADWPIALQLAVFLQLPTGDPRKNFGAGAVGYGTSVSVGKDFGRAYAFLWGNWTYFANAETSPGRREPLLLSQYGVSFGYKLLVDEGREDAQELHLLLDWGAEFNSSINPAFSTQESIDKGLESYAIAPGIRYGLWTPDKHELALAAAVPVGLTRESLHWGFILIIEIDY